MADEEEVDGDGGAEAAPDGGSVLKKYGPLAAIVLLAQVVLAWVVIQFTVGDVQQSVDDGEDLVSMQQEETQGEEEDRGTLPFFFDSGEMLQKITFNPAGTNAERFSVISIQLGLSGTNDGVPMTPAELEVDPAVGLQITKNISFIKAKTLELLRAKTIDQLNSDAIGDVGKELRDMINEEVFVKIEWDEERKKKIKVQEVIFIDLIVQ